MPFIDDLPDMVFARCAAAGGLVEVDGEMFVRRSVLRAAFRETLDEWLDAEIQLNDQAEVELDAMRRRLEAAFDRILPAYN